MGTLIDLCDLEFSYPGAAPTLEIPTWSVSAGERVFLQGPSGSGKSTLLEILAGVLRPAKGSVSVLGRDLAGMSAAERDAFRAVNLGYVFQSFNLIPYLNVRENIELPCHLSRERRARVKSLDSELAHLTGTLGLSELLARPVTALSVGQQQRVAVARALLGRPGLILADEPTSALDADHRERFLKLLFSLCEEHGTGLVFVSHDLSLKDLFDRHVKLSELQKGGGR